MFNFHCGAYLVRDLEKLKQENKGKMPTLKSLFRQHADRTLVANLT